METINKIEARKKLNSVCNWCFASEIILLFLFILILIRFNGLPEFLVILYYVTVAILFFFPFFYAIYKKVFSCNLFLNIIYLIIYLIFLGMIFVPYAGSEAAKDARIKAAMDQFRSNAEIYKLTNGNYGASINMDAMDGKTGCISVPNSMIAKGTDGNELCEDIQSQGSGEFRIYSNAAAYCIQKTLPGKPETKWCIDSKGNIGSTYTECNLVNFSCKE